jgi:hypothetical protein
MTTVIQMCTIRPLKTLLEFEVTRRPVTARKLGFTHLVEHVKKEENVNTALNYNDMAVAKMEADRQPRRAARMKKLRDGVK